MHRSEAGFTLVELMVTVLIIGALVAIAIPVFYSSQAWSKKKACYSHQRFLEGAAQIHGANTGELASLAGVVGGSHPLVAEYIFKKPPVCPAAPPPADSLNPDAAHGAYSFDDNGNVLPCGWSGHGYYATGD